MWFKGFRKHFVKNLLRIFGGIIWMIINECFDSEVKQVRGRLAATISRFRDSPDVCSNSLHVSNHRFETLFSSCCKVGIFMIQNNIILSTLQIWADIDYNWFWFWFCERKYYQQVFTDNFYCVPCSKRCRSVQIKISRKISRKIFTYLLPHRSESEADPGETIKSSSSFFRKSIRLKSLMSSTIFKAINQKIKINIEKTT